MNSSISTEDSPISPHSSSAHYYHSHQHQNDPQHQQFAKNCTSTSATRNLNDKEQPHQPAPVPADSHSGQWMRQTNHQHFYPHPHLQNPRFPVPYSNPNPSNNGPGQGNPGTPSPNYTQHHHHPQFIDPNSNPRFPMPMPSGAGSVSGSGYDERFYPGTNSKQDYYQTHPHGHGSSSYEPRSAPSAYYNPSGPHLHTGHPGHVHAHPHHSHNHGPPASDIEQGQGHGVHVSYSHCEHYENGPAPGGHGTTSVPPPGDYFHGTEYSRSYHQQQQQQQNQPNSHNSSATSTSYVRSSTSCPSYDYHHGHGHPNHPLNYQQQQQQQQIQQQFRRNSIESFSSLPPKHSQAQSHSYGNGLQFNTVCHSSKNEPSSSASASVPPSWSPAEDNEQPHPSHSLIRNRHGQDYGDYGSAPGPVQNVRMSTSRQVGPSHGHGHYSPDPFQHHASTPINNPSCAYSRGGAGPFPSTTISETECHQKTYGYFETKDQIFHGHGHGPMEYSPSTGPGPVHHVQTRSMSSDSFSPIDEGVAVVTQGNNKPKIECDKDKYSGIIKCESPSQSNIIDNNVSSCSISLSLTNSNSASATNSRPPSSCSNNSNPFPSSIASGCETPVPTPIVKSEVELEDQVNTPENNVCTTTSAVSNSEDLGIIKLEEHEHEHSTNSEEPEDDPDDPEEIEDDDDELELNLEVAKSMENPEPETDDPEHLLETPEINTPKSEICGDRDAEDQSEDDDEFCSGATAALAAPRTSRSLSLHFPDSNHNEIDRFTTNARQMLNEMSASTSTSASSLCGSGNRGDENLMMMSMSMSISPIPQKVTKRSFSEADKDLVINPTVIPNPLNQLGFKQQQQGISIRVPGGWKREVCGGKVIYSSPSDTKLKNLDEVKNYITSDGTCKCGLSCPLRIEAVFSFDISVQNLKIEEHETCSSVGNGFRCTHNHNHNLHHNQNPSQSPKRKVPLSEDSPLISSTREDLGDSIDLDPEDFPQPPAIKRLKLRDSQAHVQQASESSITVTVTDSKPTEPPSPIAVAEISQLSQNQIPVNNNVCPNVPFPQQSPDTTTQTPKREMSPASSVSSEASGSGIFYTSNSNSVTSVTFSPGSSSSTNSYQTIQGFKDFIWPGPPSGGSGSNIIIRPLTPPAAVSVAPTTTTSTTTSVSGIPSTIVKEDNKKLLPSKSASSVSIASEPPPLLNKSTKIAGTNPPTTSNPNPLQIHTFPMPMPAISPGASQSQCSGSAMSNSVSFFPIVSSSPTGASLSFTTTANTPQAPVENQLQLPLPQGFTISPILQHHQHQQNLNNNTVTVSSIGNLLPFGNGAINTYYSQIPRLTMPQLQVQQNLSTTSTTSTTITPALPSSVTISVIDQQQNQASTGANESSNKSHLDFVKEVVDRYDKDSNSESNLQAAATATAKNAAEGSAAAAATPTSSAANVSVSAPPSNLIQISSSIASPTITTTTAGPPAAVSSTTILTAAANTPAPTPVPNLHPQLIIDQKYPQILQTLQPFFLNTGPGGCPQLIISPQNQNDTGQPQFLQFDNGSNQQNSGDLTTMILDCGIGNLNNPNNGNGNGPKKKKKRLSKKQQQQQAQLQLQQQLLLHQIQQQVLAAQQQQAAVQQQQFLFPQSFNFNQGFSLQPMNMNMNMNMNFLQPAPTILTLPNLILNPTDGTLFIQQSPHPATAGPAQNNTAIPPGFSPTVTSSTSSTIKINPSQSPKSEESGDKSGENPDDSSLQNQIPDSSTSDFPSIGICTIAAAAPASSATPGNLGHGHGLQITAAASIAPVNNSSNSRKNSYKTKAVSSTSSNSVKRVPMAPKQILPKIDSTTHISDNS